MGKEIICIDFDGVIHSYSSGWKGADVIPDPPVPGAIAFITMCLDNGFSVNVFSSRSHQDNAIPAMKSWFIRHAGTALTERLHFPTYKPPALITIDDRGFLFEGTFPSLGYLQNFKPWNKRK